MDNRCRVRIAGGLVDRIEYSFAIESIINWTRSPNSRYVCFCNVHSAVTAARDVTLADAIRSADFAFPDGMPIAWLVGRRTGERQERISGPTMMLDLCSYAEKDGIPIALVGGRETTVARLRAALSNLFPNLQIAGAVSPPFHSPSREEEKELTEFVNSLKAGLVFVGLGCPKQEIWMASRAGTVDGVMLGVGAAFDFLAGTVRRPPEWMQRAGLEWLGRLITEPRRLGRRYVVTNTLFLWYVFRDSVRTVCSLV